jgi:thioredoxin 1
MNATKNQASFIAVGDADFKSEVLQSAEPVLALFWAPWSRPCQMMESVLADVAACAESVKFVKVNADDCPHLSLWYGVQFIPTLLHFVRGGLRERFVGTATKDVILSLLRRGNDVGGTVSASANEEQYEHAPKTWKLINKHL